MSGAQERVEIPRRGELFSRGYARTTVGLVLLETLVAVQLLVTVAVLPAVVADLGGLRLYGVALSASGLATAVALPVTARLVVRWGLRPVFLGSVLVFAAGTVVVITAPNMPVFIAGRLAEGAAGGAQYALMLAIFTRRYPQRLRPRMLAVWSTAWAVPGLIGPAYGGIVASTLGWRWAFGLLLPLLVPSVILLQRDLDPGIPTAQDEVAPRDPARARPSVRPSARPGAPDLPPAADNPAFDTPALETSAVEHLCGRTPLRSKPLRSTPRRRGGGCSPSELVWRWCSCHSRSAASGVCWSAWPVWCLRFSPCARSFHRAVSRRAPASPPSSQLPSLRMSRSSRRTDSCRRC